MAYVGEQLSLDGRSVVLGTGERSGSHASDPSLVESINRKRREELSAVGYCATAEQAEVVPVAEKSEAIPSAPDL